MATTTAPLSIQEKIVKGKDLKEEGNAAFKAAGTDEAKLRGAMKKYHESINYMSGLDQSQYASMMPGAPAKKVSEAEKKEINDTLVACYNNLAACQIKLSNWPRVVASANQVLKLTPTNAKALYRRGMAYRELNELAKAESDLTKADELAPGDNGVKLELAKLKKRYAEYDKKQKKEWAGLFDRMAKNEEKE